MATRTRSDMKKEGITSMENTRVFIRKVILENFLSFQKRAIFAAQQLAQPSLTGVQRIANGDQV